MGHHINSKGQFQSDKYSWLPPDKIILSFRDEYAQKALAVYAELTDEKELSEDIKERLKTICTQQG